jgi:hypothetical protein
VPGQLLAGDRAVLELGAVDLPLTAYDVPPRATNSATVAIKVDGWKLRMNLIAVPP